MWNPDTYRQFQSERDRPFFDLLGQVQGSPATVTDLGCGDGHLTAALAARWPGARVSGLDSSPEMLRGAPLAGNLHFAVGDIASWTGRPELLVSNAALQWLPDHPALIPRLAAQVAPGGTFAVQMPGNSDAPSHTLLAEVRAAPRWREQLGHTARDPGTVLSPQQYAELLHPLGYRVNAWETTYLHLLPGDDAVLNWVRGTALRPVLAALSPPQGAEFEAEYGARLREAYPQGPGGTALLFRRVFVVGVRG
jgi:trans-aconitate 2-methyltransferase